MLHLLYKNHLDVLGPHYKTEYGIDLEKTLDEMKPVSVNNFED